MKVSRRLIGAYERTVPASVWVARAITGGQYDSTVTRGGRGGFAAWVTNDLGDLDLLRMDPSVVVRAVQGVTGTRVDGVWGGESGSALLLWAGLSSVPPTEDQVRAAIERALAASLVASGWDPARSAGLEVVLPSRTELPSWDVLGGRRTIRVAAPAIEAPPTRSPVWDSARGVFPDIAAPSRPDTQGPSQGSAERIVSMGSAEVDAVVQLWLGLGLAFGVVWLFDRKRPREQRLIRVV